MRHTEPGTTVHGEDPGPPWIPVSHTVDDVIVARWPGRLWRVEVLKRAGSQPSANASYTRAIAVRVLEERPVAELFGPHGDEVCKVIAVADRLTEQDFDQLRRVVTQDADGAYSRAWSKWISRLDPTSPHVNDDLGGTLQVSVQGKRSPINDGLSLVHHIVFDRACAIAGDAAYVRDDETDDIWLRPEWSPAGTALLHAALALGAPELMSEADRDLLLSAFVRAFPNNP